MGTQICLLWYWRNSQLCSLNIKFIECVGPSPKVDSKWMLTLIKRKLVPSFYLTMQCESGSFITMWVMQTLEKIASHAITISYHKHRIHVHWMIFLIPSFRLTISPFLFETESLKVIISELYTLPYFTVHRSVLFCCCVCFITKQPTIFLKLTQLWPLFLLSTSSSAT